MRATIFAALTMVAVAIVSLAPAVAQLSPDDVVKTGPRSGEVKDALRFRRVESEITYLKPGAQFTPGDDVKIKVPEKPKDLKERRSDEKRGFGLVFGLILVAVLVLVVLFGGRQRAVHVGDPQAQLLN